MIDDRDKRKDSTRKPDLLVCCSKAQRIHNVVVKPELVVELWSPSNTHSERAIKQLLYESAGVKEFWMIDSVTAEFVIIYFENTKNFQIRQGRLDTDKLTSFIFPGLSIDLSGVLDTLDNQPGA